MTENSNSKSWTALFILFYSQMSTSNISAYIYLPRKEILFEQLQLENVFPSLINHKIKHHCNGSIPYPSDIL